jgi:hypothetical protein
MGFSCRRAARWCVVQFMSCSTLLADLRAVQKDRACLAEQLEAAQAKAARQKKQCEQEVMMTCTICTALYCMTQ